MMQLKDNMSNIEKIRQEIERRRDELERDKYINIDAKTCRQSELKYLERFIDSLPDEICKDSLQVPETCKENTDSFTSLEEAAEKYADGEMMSGLAERAFIAGGEWRKQQMMKEAVEGVVCYGSKGAYVESDWLGTTDVEVYGDSGDKVKIVIIKDND